MTLQLILVSKDWVKCKSEKNLLNVNIVKRKYYPSCTTH